LKKQLNNTIIKLNIKNIEMKNQNELHTELIESIKKHLTKGDILYVALQHGFSRYRTENVMRLRTK